MDANQGSAPSLQVLMLEDIETDADLAQHELERGGLDVTVHRVETRPDFERALESFAPDLILCDFSLPGAFDGLAAIDLTKELRPGTPLIVLAGMVGEDRLVEAMRRGAADCVSKARLGRLVPAVKRALLEAARRRVDLQKHTGFSALDDQLRDAYADERFILHYQPRLSLETGEVCGLEALMRWSHPELGLLLADEFIPALEDSGLICEVGTWALTRAAADAGSWLSKGYSVPSVGVNVSAVQLRNDDFVEVVASAIAGRSSGVNIDLELTESVVMADIEGNARKLEALRAQGIKIALDDFGTGYSSLSYPAHLPADTLKINRAFVASMTTSPTQATIVKTIISLARCLNLRAVAEGVETYDEAKLLRDLLCDEGQGYLYSRPVPAEQVGACSSVSTLIATRTLHCAWHVSGHVRCTRVSREYPGARRCAQPPGNAYPQTENGPCGETAIAPTTRRRGSARRKGLHETSTTGRATAAHPAPMALCPRIAAAGRTTRRHAIPAAGHGTTPRTVRSNNHSVTRRTDPESHTPAAGSTTFALTSS
jgi:EAL domain-containing protein (putative c-di-GMP-specific phosphodiesterase class I)/CheY-like chemotaxis protein